MDFKTNKEIKKTSYYDKGKKSNTMMKFPLNNIMDCNYYVYTLQLSTYAYMLQTLRPELEIRGLILYHIDHDNKEHIYKCDYLKDDVVKMLKHYKKQIKIQQQLDLDKPVVI